MRIPRIRRSAFYLLTFTWGLPMTLIGLIAAAFLLIAGKRPHRFDRCCHFEVGKNWGGVSLGPVILTQYGASSHLKKHEVGHSLQNCLYGFFMPLLIALPSLARYWSIRLRRTQSNSSDKAYDAVWFERQATEWGTALVEEQSTSPQHAKSSYFL